MEGLGEYLKQGRTEAGLSLEDLAGRTRIRIENLNRLEQGDLADLPTDTYVRGFVRLVCRELGLPADEGIERYEMLRAARGPADEMVWSAQAEARPPTRLERALRNPEQIMGIVRRVGIGLAAVVLILGLVAGGRFLSGLFGDRGQDEVAPAAPETEPIRLALAAIELAPREPEIVPEPRSAETAPRIDLPLAEVRVAPEPAGIVPEPRDPADRVAEGSPASEATPEPVAEVPAASEAAPAASTAPRELVAGRSSSGRLELVVEALRAVEVSVLLDGVGRPRTRSMQAGERKTWKADRLFVLSADDGSSIRLSLSGEDLGLAGQNDQPVSGLRIRAR